MINFQNLQKNTIFPCKTLYKMKQDQRMLAVKQRVYRKTTQVRSTNQQP